MATTFTQQFEAARRAGVPLLAVQTADNQATVAALLPVLAAMTRAAEQVPVVQWDASQGITALTPAGASTLAKHRISGPDSINFADALVALQKVDAGTVVFAHHAQRQLASQEPRETAAAVQGIANLRDAYKTSLRMLVLLGPVFQPPLELSHDVVTLSHPLPTAEELAAVVTELHDAAKAKAPTADVLKRATEALSGLSLFEAEQATSLTLALNPKALDLEALWERKRVAIGQTRGLSVYDGKERFDDLVGLDAIKTKLRRRIKGRTPVGVVVWIDEIDKVLANVEGDTSGVRMDQMKVLLTKMEDNEWRGFVGVGPPGAGKSAIAKAFGNEAGVPTIVLDLGDAESKWVGESQANMRHLMSVIEAVGSGHAYVIATSNAASVMRPELQRRFTDGIWMFDLLTAEERAAAWAFYTKKYALKAQPLPADDGWTGAEIRNCCREAWDTGVTLVEAAAFIVPMAQGRPEEVERLRQFAHGRLLDASKPGKYQYDAAPMQRSVRAILPATETVN